MQKTCNARLKDVIMEMLIQIVDESILANVPLKDVTMERVGVEEFRESKDEDCG